MVGEGMGLAANGGVEEVTTVCLLQHLYPHLKALLVQIKGIDWKTDFSDPVRASYQKQKMGSKDARPAAQLEHLNVSPGTVSHVSL